MFTDGGEEANPRSADLGVVAIDRNHPDIARSPPAVEVTAERRVGTQIVSSSLVVKVTRGISQHSPHERFVARAGLTDTDRHVVSVSQQPSAGCTTTAANIGVWIAATEGNSTS